jgi:hypothetical protein
MCFSAEADVVTGMAVGGAAVVGLLHVERRRDWPLAALPVVLGGHLLVEAAVWRGLEGHLPARIWRSAAWAYMAIAFVVIPILVPVAIAASEPITHWKEFVPLVVVGLIAASILGWGLVFDPTGARIDGRHIHYDITVRWAIVTVTCYVAATCLPALISKDPAVRIFGTLNLVAVALLVAIQRNGLTSLWCAWAAITSVVIAAHLRVHSRARNTVWDP